MSAIPSDWRSHPAPAWPRPRIGDHPIEGYRYTSREFFAREFDSMWTKVWLLLGREDEMPRPGDWQREEVGPESILMVRQHDGAIKAFYNVCQHRGNRLVFDAKGHVRRFVCKYHSWAYLPDGRRLVANPGVILRRIGDTPGHEVIDDEVVVLAGQEAFFRFLVCQDQVRILDDRLNQRQLEMQARLVARTDDLAELKFKRMLALVNGEYG